jgi:hypothetical protein
LMRPILFVDGKHPIGKTAKKSYGHPNSWKRITKISINNKWKRCGDKMGAKKVILGQRQVLFSPHEKTGVQTALYS